MGLKEDCERRKVKIMNMLSKMSEKAKRGLILILAVSMILCSDLPLYASSVSEDRVGTEAALSDNEPNESVSADESQRNPLDETEVSENESAEPERETPENQEPGEISGNEVSENEVSDNEVPDDQVSENEVSENQVSENQVSENEVSANDIFEEIAVSGNEVSANSVSRNIVDDLPVNENSLEVLTEKAKAVIDKKGRIVVTWKAAKKAKRYRVDRQMENGAWEQVWSGTKKKFIDQMDTSESQTYLYRIVPYGTDTVGRLGFGRPGYALCAPTILSAQARTLTEKDTDYYIGVDYTSIKGAAEYEIQHAYKKNKDYLTAAVVSNLNGKMEKPPYMGTVVSTYNGKRVLTESYLDGKDSNFPLRYKEYYYYRIRAHVEVDGRSVYSAYSKPVKARVTIRAPKIYPVGNVSYNSVTLFWENMPDVTGDDSYYIYKSTKPDSGFKRTKKVKRWELESVNLASPLNGTTPLNGTSTGGTNTAEQKVDALAYTLTNLKCETTYYFKIAAVKESVVGAQSVAVSAKPVLTDVTGLSVNSANYNKIKISFNEVPGATKYYVYEAKTGVTDFDGKVLPVSEWRFSKKALTCTSKAKDGIVTYTRSGLKRGQYYGYYVLPVRGKKHETPEEKLEFGYAYTRMGKPEVTAGAKDLYSIKVSWNKVAGATGYRLEYSTDEDFKETATDRRSLMFSKYSPNKANKKVFTNRSYLLEDLAPGVKYYFRVTAYKFTKAEGLRQEYGVPGEPSDIKCEWGRPQAIKNLKAEFDDKRRGEGATLTWSKSTESNVKYYGVKRSVYNYDAKKNKVGSCVEEDITLIAAEERYEKTSYKDSSKIDNGMYVKYEVCGYYAPSGTTRDQWIEGKYASAIYMNPSAIKIAGTIQIGVGQTITPKITFTPKATTNKSVQWTIESVGGSSYISLDNTTGKLKGLKKTKSKQPIEIVVASRNDYNVRAVCKVTVTDKTEEVAKGNLIVCLDPGHGGSDSGAGYGSLVEKNINLQTSRYTKERLEQYGVTVHMTRSSDTYVGLEARTKYAKDHGCNLFVSQHMNSGGGSGTEVYYSLTQYGRRDLAAKISSKVSSALGIPNRGAKTRAGQNGDYYSVIRTSAAQGIPGLIVEGAFLDGNSGVAGNAQAIGYATADAILEYYGYK